MRWHHALAPCTGTMRWHHALAPCAGTIRWHHTLVPYAGTIRWHHTLAPYAGTITWSSYLSIKMGSYICPKASDAEPILCNVLHRQSATELAIIFPLSYFVYSVQLYSSSSSSSPSFLIALFFSFLSFAFSLRPSTTQVNQHWNGGTTSWLSPRYTGVKKIELSWDFRQPNDHAGCKYCFSTLVWLEFFPPADVMKIRQRVVFQDQSHSHQWMNVWMDAMVWFVSQYVWKWLPDAKKFLSI